MNVCTVTLNIVHQRHVMDHILYACTMKRLIVWTLVLEIVNSVDWTWRSISKPFMLAREVGEAFCSCCDVYIYIYMCLCFIIFCFICACLCTFVKLAQTSLLLQNHYSSNSCSLLRSKLIFYRCFHGNISTVPGCSHSLLD